MRSDPARRRRWGETKWKKALCHNDGHASLATFPTLSERREDGTGSELWRDLGCDARFGVAFLADDK